MSPRISDERIRALVEGPFFAVYGKTDAIVALDYKARRLGTYAVRYHSNYLCMGIAGEPPEEALAWIDIAQQELGAVFSVLKMTPTKLVDALEDCFHHLIEHGGYVDTGTRCEDMGTAPVIEPFEPGEEAQAGRERYPNL